MKPRLFVLLFLAALMLALGAAAAACGDDEAGFLSVVLDDDLTTGSIVDEETGAAAFTANAGEITFEVHNEGSESHELVIIRTDLVADALPFTDVSNNLVDEEAAGEKIGEIEEFRGRGAVLSGDVQMEVASFTLTPGRYVLICNLTAHYRLGMFAELTVEE